MNTEEAIQAMIDGKKVRNKTWSSYIYIYFDGDTLVDSNGIMFNNLSVSFTDDWEIYKEPKPKQTVVIEKWLCKTKMETFIVIEGDANELNSRYKLTKVKLLKTYEEEL